jgi:hypothetical protein
LFSSDLLIKQKAKQSDKVEKNYPQLGWNVAVNCQLENCNLSTQLDKLQCGKKIHKVKKCQSSNYSNEYFFLKVEKKRIAHCRGGLG